MTANPHTDPTRRKANLRIAAVFTMVVAGMAGMAYASVPLYRVFCQVTGFGGTPRISSGGGKVLDQKITVAFDSNVNRGMPWKFRPVQRAITMRIGEEKLAFFEATNTSGRTITGTAVFNVSPPLAGQYFNKVQCFCFTEQTLKPGEKASMPVTFFVDPEVVNDPDLKNLKTITLSYTFYEKEGGGKTSSSRPAKPATTQLAANRAGNKDQR